MVIASQFVGDGNRVLAQYIGKLSQLRRFPGLSVRGFVTCVFSGYPSQWGGTHPGPAVYMM
jgi:hypothetical protein